MSTRHTRWLSARQRTAGFTLVELMVIVLIIGILSMIAIPTYTGYLYRSKTTEGVGFLADIKSRQESYRSEYLQYCKVSTGAENWWPSTKKGSGYHWDPASLPTGWSHLGASPPSLYGSFQYVSVAEGPGSANLPDSKGFSDSRGYDGNDFWFISRAQADLDNDGTFITIESYSARHSVWMSEDKGWE